MKCRTTIFGSSNPEIYFIEDVNHDNNVSLNGDLFTLILDSFGLNSNNCRFNSIVRDENCEDLSNEDIFINDIINSNPKIIVTVGGSASDEVIGEEFKRITADHGKIFKTSIVDALVIPVYHPTYVSKQENIVARTEFKNDIKKCIDLCTGAKTIKDYTKDEYDNDNVVCLTYEDFDKFCKEELDDAVDISYDIESNAKEKTSKDYRVVGFSLASREERSCYVVLESLDYTVSNRDKKLIESRLRHLLLKKKTFVYSCMHELPATLNWLSIEMPDIEDLFVMVKLMMGNAEKYEGNGGLKAQCSINLNTKDWSEDLDIYFDYLRDLGNKKDNMKALLLKYYETSEIDHIMTLVEEAYNDSSTFDSPVISYGKVPYKLIGRYGGTDSAILYPLRSFYQKKIENMNNELGIDLNIGYRYWMNHHYAGYTLERNGAHWNDKKATDIQVWCEEGMQESLKNLVKDPLSEPYIKDKLEWNFYSYLKDNYIDSILGMNAKPKRITKNSVSVEVLVESFKDTLKLMSIEPKVQKKKDGTCMVKNEYKLELGHIKTLAKPFLDSNPGLYDKWYTEYMEQFFSETRTVDEMKNLLNPTATAESFRVFVSNLLITDDIHYAKFYTDLIKITEEPNFDIGYYDRGDYMKDDKKLLELVLKLQSLEDMSKPNKLRVVNKFLSGNINLQSRKIKNALSTALSYNLESFNDYFILELYELYVLCGLDIEDKSTWTPQFNWLYNFRRYKKFSKMISTYIKGKVGRNSVWYVDKNSLENGDILTKRLIPYNKAIEDQIDTSNMDTILQTDFKVDMADTGRWKATMHTMPAGPTIKGIITSRYKGGVIFCPDCSQAEVRVLAAQSQDENLINAFMQDGMDIHKFVASLVFHNGDIEAVTSVERKIAKGAVFGILYGESEKSFADSFFHGDMNEALKVFDYFYTAFPKIKDYITSAHNQFDKYHKVILPIMNRFLNMEALALENGSDTDKIYRQAQNFIIQGQTCDLAGLILYNICKYIKDHNLKSKVFCFIHDSIEIDVPPEETFLMADMLKPLFNKYPWDNFKVPMASDIVVGASMGQESDIDILEHDEEYNEVTVKLKGFMNDIDELIGMWNEVYDVVETIEKEVTDTEYVPIGGLFQKKVVISKEMGTTKEKGSCKLHIIRKKV